MSTPFERRRPRLHWAVIAAVTAVACLVPSVAASSAPGQPSPAISNQKDAPLWRGTPYYGQGFLTPGTCEQFSAGVPASKALFLERVIVTYDLSAGGTGLATLRLTPLPGTVADQQSGPGLPVGAKNLSLPAYPSSPTGDYGAEIEIGLPVVALASCSGSAHGIITAIGYLVDRP